MKQGFFASVGLPFCFAQLTSREAVDRARMDKTAWAQRAKAWSPNVFFFAGDLANGSALYARMCAPALGIEEDPATGALARRWSETLAAPPEFQSETFRLSIQQGVAIPPQRHRSDRAEVERYSRVVSVGGATAYVAAGEIDMPRGSSKAEVCGGLQSAAFAEAADHRANQGLAASSGAFRLDRSVALRTADYVSIAKPRIEKMASA